MSEGSLNFIMLLDSDVLDELAAGAGTSLRIETTAMMFVTSGRGKITINLEEYSLAQDDFITILQGSIIEVREYSADFEAWYINFSSGFTRDIDLWKNTMDSMATITGNPVLTIETPEGLLLMKNYCAILRDISVNRITYQQEVLKNILEAVMFTVSGFYRDKYDTEEVVAARKRGGVKISRRHDIHKRFLDLVTKNYETRRDVAYYAGLLCITPKHLSYVVKSTSGKLASDVISEMVVMDAKSKLKSSGLSIGEVSDSLNFPNPSFFCKYFKKHTGNTPKQYRDTVKE